VLVSRRVLSVELTGGAGFPSSCWRRKQAETLPRAQPQNTHQIPPLSYDRRRRGSKIIVCQWVQATKSCLGVKRAELLARAGPDDAEMPRRRRLFSSRPGLRTAAGESASFAKDRAVDAPIPGSASWRSIGRRKRRKQLQRDLRAPAVVGVETTHGPDQGNGRDGVVDVKQQFAVSRRGEMRNEFPGKAVF